MFLPTGVTLIDIRDVEEAKKDRDDAEDAEEDYGSSDGSSADDLFLAGLREMLKLAEKGFDRSIAYDVWASAVRNDNDPLKQNHWVKVGEEMLPSVAMLALKPAYTGLGFGKALLDTVLQLPEVKGKDHLLIRMEQWNSPAMRCVAGIREKHGRTLHKVGW